MPWLNSAALTVLVPAGSAWEPASRAGLAAFTADMVMRGAGERDSRQLVLELDTLGVDHGESVGTVHASFRAAMLCDKLPAVLAIHADILRRPHLPEDKLEAARQLLFQELQAVEDDPAQKLLVELRRRHYPSPLGRPSHGDRAGLEATTIADVRQFFAQHYRPNGAILGVAGKFDWDQLINRVGELLSDWRPGEVRQFHEEPTGSRRRHIPANTEQMHIGIAWSCVPYAHPDYYQAWGALAALSVGMSSRLCTEVRERRGLCYHIDAVLETNQNHGAMLCYAGTTAARAQETLDVTLSEILRWTEGIRSDELDRAKAHAKSALVMQQESAVARSAAIAREWTLLGHARSLDEVHAAVKQLTCESINSYLAAHPPREFTILTLGPRALEVPDGVP
jgi:predicted Zn-dependent peptidase